MRKRVHYAWLILAGCCALIFISYGLCNNVAGQFVTAICADMGFSKGSISTYMTVQGFAQLFMIPILGKKFSNMNLRRYMTAFAILLAICFFMMSFAQKPVHWWIIGAVSGISMSFIGMLPVNILLSNWFQQKHSFAVGMAMSFSGVSGVILNPLVLTLIEAFGWRKTYRMISVLVLLVLLPFTVFILRKKPEEMGLKPYGALTQWTEAEQDLEAAKGVPYSQAKRMPELYLLIIMTASTAFCAALNQHMSGMAVSKGLPVSVGAIAVTLLMGVYVISRLSTGVLCSVFAYQNVCISCLALGLFGMLLLFLVSDLSANMFFAAAVLYAIGSSMASFAEPIVTKNTFGTQDYDRIYSIVSLTLSFVGSIGISFHAFIYDWTGGYQVSYFFNIICFAISITCIVLITLYSKKRAMN